MAFYEAERLSSVEAVPSASKASGDGRTRFEEHSNVPEIRTLEFRVAYLGDFGVFLDRITVSPR